MQAIDYTLLAMWLVICFRNKAALLPLLILILDLAMFDMFQTDFERYVSVAIACFISSIAGFEFDLKIRKALFAFGCIYAIGALDWFLYLHHDIETFYYDVIKYLVTGFNAYIAALLLTTGGRSIVDLLDGLYSIVRRRLSWL